MNFIRKTTLENGVRILSHKLPHVRSIAMGIWVDMGSRDENKDEYGYAHFLEHMMFKGTERRSAYELAKAFDSIGGQSNAFTTMETTCYHARVMDSHMDIMTDILSDMFLNSCFDSEEIENEKAVVLQEIDMMQDSPEDFAHHLLEKHAWGAHPLGRSILGSAESIKEISSEKLFKFFNKYYSPSRIIISLAGNLEHEKAVDLLAPAFEKLKKSKGRNQRSQAKLHTGIHISTKAIEQAHLYIGAKGLPLAHENRFSASLLTSILGGNMSSRLFQEIREKRGLAYSVYSFSSSHEDVGMLGIYAGVAPATIEKSAKLIYEEAKKLSYELVSGEELEAAKAYTKGQILLSMENTENLMIKLAQNEIYFGRYIHTEETLKALDTVNREDIMQLACTAFDKDKVLVSILSPMDQKLSLA